MWCQKAIWLRPLVLGKEQVLEDFSYARRLVGTGQWRKNIRSFCFLTALNKKVEAWAPPEFWAFQPGPLPRGEAPTLTLLLASSFGESEAKRNRDYPHLIDFLTPPILCSFPLFFLLVGKGRNNGSELSCSIIWVHRKYRQLSLYILSTLSEWWLLAVVIATFSNFFHTGFVLQQTRREELFKQRRKGSLAGAQNWWVIKVWIQDGTIFHSINICWVLLGIILGARNTVMNTTEETDKVPETPAPG